jgi:predicted DNA-binding transcriptional regulator AlpA
VTERARVPEAWPALLSRLQASAYCGVSEDTFDLVCPVAPRDLGKRVLVWSRAQLDAWIDGLPPRLRGARKEAQALHETERTEPDPADAGAAERRQNGVDRARLRAAKGRGGERPCPAIKTRPASRTSSASAAPMDA